MKLPIAIAMTLVSSLAVAKPSLTSAQKTTYAAKLKEGRALSNKKDYKAAIAAFQAALVANPGEPTALGELGFTAYLAKDLKLAEVESAASSFGSTTSVGLFSTGDCNGQSALADSFEIRSLAIFGVGASGKPSMIDVMTYEKHVQEYDGAFGDETMKNVKPVITIERQIVPAWKDGKLAFTGKGLAKGASELVPVDLKFP